MASTNKELGLQVKEHLVKLGVETPIVENNLSDDEKIEKLTELHHSIHEVLGLDVNDDSITETPHRIAKLQVLESMKGLNYDNFPKMTTVQNKFYEGMVSVNDIKVHSLCEHHHERVTMLVSIAYIPEQDGKVLGLSKLARLADFFGSRPIVQERFTTQVIEAMKFILETENVAIHVRGIHMCMYSRGVKEPCSNTTTTILSGEFKTDLALRGEFLKGIDITKPIIG